MSFAHLHVHSEYSLLDGACRIEPMLDKIKSMGQTSVAITDHGVMYGVLKFYGAAKERGLNPVIGCEVYVAPRSRFDKVHGIDSERYHLILLCENNEGYKNLIKIVSEGWVNGFYTKPRVDREVLSKYHEGIIALSGCLFGEVSQNLLKGDYQKAKETALWYESTFGKGNYFLEIQNHGLDDQIRVNPDIIKLSNELGIPLAATNDAHYINKEDSKIQQVLICIQTNHILGEDTGLEFGAEEFYLKSEEEMLTAFDFCPEAVKNTALIAERCKVDFEFGKTKLPHFELPDNADHFEWFKKMCLDGFYRLYGENAPKEYLDRMNYELDVINRMGYIDYYLIVQDFVDYAKKHDIPVGPGRGSGAASICAYCCGITGIDPMKNNLLFERFLNPERVSMPDFDIDFCYERRPEVIDYIIDKYGSDHVAQIVTFGTMAAKAAVRDVGRVMGVPYGIVDAIAKAIPNELNMTIGKALEVSKEFSEIYHSDETAKEIIDMSIKVEGMPRHASIHAAGVVITADPVDDYVPLSKNDDAVVTQFTMKDLEMLGLLKMDFLGLRTLTVIKTAEKEIKKTNPGFSIDNIDTSDKKIYKMFASGKTEGVFQFESAGMKKVLTQLKPENFEDIVAVIALYRPGPMESIPDYIRNKSNPGKITYKTPALKNILDVTYGCIVYQEQVMQICRDIAGYSFGRSDIVRRAMAKKQHDVMLKERDNFVHGITDENGNVICEGAVRRGVSEKAANEIFDEMVSFASYAFNKAHAAAYAYVSYQTAYLKYYYPKIYFASLLTSLIDNPGKISEYISEAEKLGIKILPPHVNTSDVAFIPCDDGISFSLAAIKSIGTAFIRKMSQDRTAGGKFEDLYDFCDRMYGKDLNRRAIESLIKCGAFDGLRANRRQMIQSLDFIFDELDRNKRKNISGQIGFGDLSGNDDTPIVSGKFSYPDVSDFSNEDKLKFEKEVAGLYLTGNPLSDYTGYFESIRCDKIRDIVSDRIRYPDNGKIIIAGIISSINKKIAKNNTPMAFFTLDDSTGSAECIAFSKIYEKYKAQITEGSVVTVSAKASCNDDGSVSMIADTIEPVIKEDTEKLKTAPSQNNTQTETALGHKRLFLRFTDSSSPQIKVCSNLISIFEGKIPVYYYYEDTRKYVKTASCDCNEVLMRELKKILGNDNTILK